MVTDFTIAQGSEVRDRITGFNGLVTGRCQYITGCNQYLVQPSTNEKGEFVEARWFDENRLVIDSWMRKTELADLIGASADDGPDVPAPIK